MGVRRGAVGYRVVDGHRFFLCHAAPTDPLFKYLPPESGSWLSEAEAVDADVVLVGHTHLPFELRLGGRRIVNPGSVGQPKHGAPEACYAIWRDGVVELKSAVYQTGATIRRLMALPIALHIREQLAGILSNGHLPA